MRLLFVVPIALLSLGCDIPAQIEWSPDGSSAAYFNGNHSMLLDEQGRIVAQLGESAGGFAWSADSKHLYVAIDLKQSTTTKPATETSQPATTQAADGSIIYDLHDGAHVEIARLPGQHVVHLCFSSTGRWLAIAGLADGGQPRPHATITVFSLITHRSSIVSTRAIGMTFVTKDTLAFGEMTSGENADFSDSGLISEVKLDDEMDSFMRRDLIQIIPSRFGWMQACEGDILFTQQPLASPQPIDHADPHGNLYRFNRANSGLTCVTEDVGALFAVSPNGKKILFEKDIWPEMGASGQESSMGGNRPATKLTSSPTTAAAQRRELSVMNANGSDSHLLRILKAVTPDEWPLLPAWHGDDSITYVDPTPLPIAAGEHRTHFPMVDYRLNDSGQLSPIRRLSDGWQKQLLPGSAVVPN